MLEELKKEVFEANLALVDYNLVIFTWGNVSAIDREQGLMVIKPSGVPYDTMKVEDMVVTNMEGEVLEGKMRPSSDAATHLVLYKAFEKVGSIVHTHSTYATAWSQAGRGIKSLGTTHADHFYGEIPCTRELTSDEIKGKYEVETGNVIVETFKNIDPLAVPSVLVNDHGPFSWGENCKKSVYNAAVLEEVARMSLYTQQVGEAHPVSQALSDKHYFRKHGKNAYYGQK